MENAEGLFNLKYGVAGVCVMLCLLFLLKVLEIWMKAKDRKEELSDKALTDLTFAARDLTAQLKCINDRMVLMESTFKKFDLDMRRLYAALKLVAGEGWTEISEKIRKDLHI